MARRKLAEIRTQRLQKTKSATTNPGELDLLDFVATLNPRYERPEHLAIIARLFERAETEEVRALISVPPQHGKTELLVNGLARRLRRQPWKRNAYATYGDRMARKKARACRDVAEMAGVELRNDATAVNDWATTDNGGLIATGIGGPLTGSPVDGMLVIDDPHKDRAEAESALARERVYDWWTSTALSRIHPGASVLVCHTRWHVDDFIGRLSKETKTLPDGRIVPSWEVINLPAVQTDGSPLWHQRPLSFLEQHRANDYDWWSLWMGSPRPRGTSVFRGVKFYDRLPDTFRVGKGTDLAYTAKTRADSSCAVVLLESGADEKGKPLYYVAEVERAQCEAPEFVRTLARLDVSYPTGAWHWFCSTTEKGVAQIVSDAGTVTIDPVLATADKFVRAQYVATAWNEGRILVPRSASWLKAFVDELGNFTGVSDRHDDQVDALASAFEGLRKHLEIPAPPPAPPSRWGDSTKGF